jgi:23S rRNA-/tRNA-specific pseudouridylate synthase
MHWTISDPAPDDPRERPSTVLRHAARAAGVSDAMARELLDMGAVYVDELPEGPGPTATRSKKSGGGQEEAAPRVKWRRCANDPGAILAPGRRLRIHKDPRRYRDGCWLGGDEWRARTIHECADYLVVNKPARLPTQAHESNATECVVGCAERSLGLEPGALRVTHRLDASTSGVVVLGKSKAAVAAFTASVHAERALLTVDPLKDDERSSDLPTDDEAAPRSSDAASGTDDSSGGSSAEKAGSSSSPPPPSISKTYVALTRGASPLPLGSVTHWMYPGPFGADAVELGGVKKSQARPLRSVNVRGELRYKGEVRAANWKRCRLVVLSCERAEPCAARKWEKAHAQHLKLSHKKEPVVATECIGTESDPVVMWEVRVRLLTGRTHQIRAQLAALGHPICGDSLYAPMKGFLLESAGRELEPGDPRGTIHGADSATVAEAARRIAAGVVPDWPVALHAEALEWGERAFYAPPPWREEPKLF